MEWLAAQLGQPTLDWLVTLERATRAAIAGDTDRAEQLATEALQIGSDGGEPDAGSIFGAQVLTVSFQRGTMGDLAPLIEQMAADNPGAAPTAIAVLAAAHAEADRLDDARRRLEEFASGGFELPLDLLWMTGMTLYAEAAIQCRERRSAQVLFDHLAPWRVGCHTPPLRLRARSATSSAASHPFSAASTRRTPISPRPARSANGWARSSSRPEPPSRGESLAERRVPGDAERARELLTKAQAAAAAHGYKTVDRRAAAALQLLDS